MTVWSATFRDRMKARVDRAGLHRGVLTVELDGKQISRNEIDLPDEFEPPHVLITVWMGIAHREALLHLEKIAPLTDKEFRCNGCLGTFPRVADGTVWNEELADVEAAIMHPGLKKEDRVIVCDDCYKLTVGRPN